ncbi:ribosome silencing factor [Desulfonatronum sp. SC1]|uniref:ribosome silencing factor n=1 Tax=Desulfonatronum sp. SC1 TaxID=2109626 RepID=UPI000D318113|nr:ribosome silencing factor [Desulfonatronum sp. SC1]PTN37646.1 ribosome silencing factor [Desulfonatronum sp. SC1]
MKTRPATKEQTLAATPREIPGDLTEATQGQALAVAGWLEEKKARDISVLDVTPFSAVADVMVICSAQSARHAQALADWLLERYAEQGIGYLGMEGYTEGRWILVDGNDVLVHIFQEESREFYNLDGLWSRARSLLDDPNPEPPSDKP